MARTLTLRPTPADPLTLLSGRAKRLGGQAYTIEGGSAPYGLDVVSGDGLGFDESKMSAWILYADGNRRDGVGDKLNVAGIVTERHVKNPIVLFDHGKGSHKFATWPIATARDPQTGEYVNTIDPVGQTAKINAFFYQGKGLAGVERDDEYEFARWCEQLYDLWCKRYINGGSIGYQVIHAKHLQADYDNGYPQGLLLHSVMMLEASPVVLPANMDTVRKCYGCDLVREALSLPRICGTAPSPYLVKSLTPYASTAKAQLGYEGKSMGAKSQIAGDLGWLKEEEREGEHKSIPPAKWKPGVGAIKALREKYRTKSQPSDKIKPAKACQILKDNSAQGHELTQKQRGMFGAACGKKGHPMSAAIKTKAMKDMEEMPNGGGVEAPAPGETDAPDPAVTDGNTSTEPEGENAPAEKTEPYGAQVLRRAHENALLLMQEYDEMLEVLEHVGVKEHLTKKLQMLEEELQEIESLFAQKYKDLDGIEGAMPGDVSDKDFDETPDEEAVEEEETPGDETEASSDAGEEVPPEEAVEGMRKSQKALPGKKCKGAGCTCGTKQIPGYEEFQKKPGSTGVDVAAGTDIGVEEHQSKPGHEGTSAASDTDLGVEEHQEKPGENYPSLAEHHVKAIADATGYLHDLHKEDNFGDEHRMKAYHHHKSLDHVAEDLAALKLPNAGTKDYAGVPDAGTTNYPHPAYKSIKDASEFLHVISRTHDFGDVHRERARLHAKLLAPLTHTPNERQQTEQDALDSPQTPDGGGAQIAPADPGAIGQKALSLEQLHEVLVRQNTELNNRIKEITKFTELVTTR